LISKAPTIDSLRWMDPDFVINSPAWLEWYEKLVATVNAGGLPGPTGPTGPTGATGPQGSPGTPGATAHGALTGLGNDDHTQYHNDTRGDARYAPLAKGVTNGDSHDHVGGDGAQIDHGGLAGLSDNDHTQYPLITELWINRGATNQDPNSPSDHVILTNHANTPDSNFYWYITTTKYPNDPNYGQIAVMYNNNGNTYDHRVYSRHKYTATEGWTDWVRISNEQEGISFIIDGGGVAITTGIKGDIEIPFNCYIKNGHILADVSGSIRIDMWKDVYANYPPVAGDILDYYYITSAIKGEFTPTPGAFTFAKGDILRINVYSCTTITRCTLSLQLVRT